MVPEIEYCQGMNYIAATLYCYLEDTHLTFDLFMCLLVHKNLFPLFEKQIPEYHLRNFILSELIKKWLPRLFNHFASLQLNLEMLTSQWIMTFFTGYFPINLILPVLDNFFADGWPAIYRFSLALLSLLETDFL